MSRKGSCRNPRGIFPTESQVNFAGDLLLVFVWPFSLETRRKKTPKNPRQNSNQNLGALRGSGFERLPFDFGGQQTVEKCKGQPEQSPDRISRPKSLIKVLKVLGQIWQVPNPPGAYPLVAERAFSATDN